MLHNCILNFKRFLKDRVDDIKDCLDRLGKYFNSDMKKVGAKVTAIALLVILILNVVSYTNCKTKANKTDIVQKTPNFLSGPQTGHFIELTLENTSEVTPLFNVSAAISDIQLNNSPSTFSLSVMSSYLETANIRRDFTSNKNQTTLKIPSVAAHKQYGQLVIYRWIEETKEQGGTIETNTVSIICLNDVCLIAKSNSTTLLSTITYQ